MNEYKEYSDIYRGGASILIAGVLLNGKTVDIFISADGKIEDLSENTRTVHRSDAEFIIDASGKIALPGLVNTHTHAAMTLLRGYADDMHLHEWLTEKIWPLEAHLTGEDVYWGTKLACLEMIKSGTVAFNDMYFFMEDAARAVDETGMKAVLSHGFIDFGNEEKRDSEIASTKKLISYIKSMNNPRIKGAVGPHAPYTVSKDALEWCSAYSEEEDIKLHIHLSETEKEVNDCINEHAMRPAELLDKCNCLSSRTIAAHCCWLDEKECRILGKKGVHVSHNPASNMKLAVNRAMPYQWLKDAGANVTLGTDGCSSNNNLDLSEEMKTAALLQKFYWNSDTLLPAGETLAMATSAGKKALGFGNGRIEQGEAADIILIDRNCACMTPLHNPVSNVVYSCNGNAVNTVICDGRVLMSEREVPGEEEILSRAEMVAESLVGRAKEE